MAGYLWDGVCVDSTTIASHVVSDQHETMAGNFFVFPASAVLDTSTNPDRVLITTWRFDVTAYGSPSSFSISKYLETCSTVLVDEIPLEIISDLVVYTTIILSIAYLMRVIRQVVF